LISIDVSVEFLLIFQTPIHDMTCRSELPLLSSDGDHFLLVGPTEDPSPHLHLMTETHTPSVTEYFKNIPDNEQAQHNIHIRNKLLSQGGTR
jgi:hypothetical protein